MNKLFILLSIAAIALAIVLVFVAGAAMDQASAIREQNLILVDQTRVLNEQNVLLRGCAGNRK